MLVMGEPSRLHPKPNDLKTASVPQPGSAVEQPDQALDCTIAFVDALGRFNLRANFTHDALDSGCAFGYVARLGGFP